MRARLIAAGLCALCALLGGVTAVALAAPGHGGVNARRAGAKRSGKCTRRGRHKDRHGHRCHAQRRSSAEKPPSLGLTAATGPSATAPTPPAAPLLAPPIPAPTTTDESSKATTAVELTLIEPPVVPHVQVSAVEYSFSLSRTTVPAGKVILQFVNNGQDEHNLHLESAEGPLSESIADTASKGVSNLELEMRPGAYTLFCSLPTHEAEGMKATLLVE